MFSRASAPPTPGHKRFRPEEQDLPCRIGYVGHATSHIDGSLLYLASQQRANIREGTSDEVRNQ
eukprot:8169061-Pyramimonas_sp.AAC.1